MPRKVYCLAVSFSLIADFTGVLAEFHGKYYCVTFNHFVSARQKRLKEHL